MRENRQSGSMSGEWKRSVSHRATPRLYYIFTRSYAVVFVCPQDPVNSATLKAAWKAQRSQVLDGLTSYY